MVNFEKSQPAPNCLASEKSKASGDYKCGDVLERLKSDFKNKCYLCEQKAPSNINVEHFQSHQGNLDLKFDWNNLYWSCSHCNNIKSSLYDDILNCNDSSQRVDSWIKYEIDPFPKEKAKISIIEDETNADNTVELLDKIYNGSTNLKTIEAANIRQKLLLEIRDFQNWLFEYFEEEEETEQKIFLRRKIENHLRNSSNFTAFKRWIIWKNEAMNHEFGELIT